MCVDFASVLLPSRVPCVASAILKLVTDFLGAPRIRGDFCSPVRSLLCSSFLLLPLLLLLLLAFGGYFPGGGRTAPRLRGDFSSPLRSYLIRFCC